MKKQLKKEAKVKKSKKIGRIKMMDQQKKEMVIPQEIANPEDDCCKVSQDQQAMKAADQSQSADQRQFCKQLWTVASKGEQ